jgi:hypothetical protein
VGRQPGTRAVGLPTGEHTNDAGGRPNSAAFGSGQTERFLRQHDRAATAADYTKSVSPRGRTPGGAKFVAVCRDSNSGPKLRTFQVGLVTGDRDTASSGVPEFGQTGR